MIMTLSHWVDDGDDFDGDTTMRWVVPRLASASMCMMIILMKMIMMIMMSDIP